MRGGRPGRRGIRLPARGDGISCPRQAQALWPAGSQAKPGTGPLRQAAAVSQAARARAAKLPEARPPARSASAVESTVPVWWQSARRRGWRGRKARHGAAGQQEGGPSNWAALLLCCSPLGGLGLPLLHHFNVSCKICQQLSQRVSVLKDIRCWRQQAGASAPYGLPPMQFRPPYG